MKRIVLCFLLFVLVLVAPLNPQGYEVSVTTVTVWVKVTDKSGNPVTQLSVKDFKLYEDDKPVNITCFEETLDQATPESLPQTTEATATHGNVAEAPPARRMVLFLDLLNTSMPEFAFIKPKLLEFLNQISTGNWNVMLTVTTPDRKATILIPFTENLETVRTSLDQLKGNSKRDQSVSSRKRQISTLLTVDSSEDTIRKAYALAAGYAREEKNSAEFSIGALESFAKYISKGNGEHTAIALVSGGINVEPGRIYYETINRLVERQAMNQDSTDWALRMGGSNRESNYDLRKDLQKSIARLNRNNLTLYSINTRGTVNPGFDNIQEQSSTFVLNDPSFLKDFQDSLDQVAEESGGLSFKNSNMFRHGFDEIVRDLRHSYTICYAPPENRRGNYHKIRVVCERKDTVVRHRRGYQE